ncbi:hypothetical protein H4R35_005656 [Dimargaris xerosporica]|nr:hypothetical protein H4R35_005656 [Dimargaris xerosporica]
MGPVPAFAWLNRVTGPLKSSWLRRTAPHANRLGQSSWSSATLQPWRSPCCQYHQGPWRAGGANTQKLMANLPRLQFPGPSKATLYLCTAILGAIAATTWAYLHYFGAALRYPASVRKLLREALLYHRHATNLDYPRAIQAYHRALRELARYPDQFASPADPHVLGILIELADVYALAERYPEAIAVNWQVWHALVGTFGVANPAIIAHYLANGRVQSADTLSTPSNLTARHVQSSVQPVALVQTQVGLGDRTLPTNPWAALQGAAATDIRHRIIQAAGASQRLGSLYEHWLQNASWLKSPLPTDQYQQALTECEEAFEWGAQVLLVAYGLYHQPKPTLTRSPTTTHQPFNAPIAADTTQAESERLSQPSKPSFFATLPTLSMSAKSLPPWLSYTELGGCLESLALYYASLGNQPHTAFAILASVIELLGGRDDCHASVLMLQNAELLADHLSPPKDHYRQAKHWLKHALAVAKQSQHSNPECNANCSAIWYSYGALDERLGNTNGARKWYKRALYHASENHHPEAIQKCQKALHRLAAVSSSAV